MSFKSFFFVAIVVSTVTFQVKANTNACSTKDTTGFDAEDLLVTYLGNPKLFNAYLLRFRSHPYLENFFKHLKDDASNPNREVSLLALETALMASNFLGNKANNTCDFSLAVDLAVEYENTGDIDTLICAIDYVRATSSDSIDRAVEFFLQEVGCGSYYDKPETVSPSCGNKKCIANGRPAKWKDSFKYIVNHMKDYQAPANVGIYDSLERIFRTDDKNLWGAVLSWYAVELHASWLHQAGINEDPEIVGLIEHILHLMEPIAYSKECSCEDRVRLVSAAQERLDSAVTTEINYLKAALKKKFSK